MEQLSPQQKLDIVTSTLEQYASGLDDSGKEAQEIFKMLSMYEEIFQCSRCNNLVPEKNMRKDKRRNSPHSWCKECDKEDARTRRSLKHKPLKALEISLKKLEKLTITDTRELRFQWSLIWKNINRLKENG